MLQKLSIVPNVPQQIALKFPVGKLVEGRFGDQVYYTLAHPANTCIYLDLIPAGKIDQLELAKGELVNICKRWTGSKKDSPVWDVWRVDEDTVQPVPVRAAPAPIAPAGVAPVSQLEADLIRSIAHVQSGATIPQPPVRNGHGAASYAAAGIPAPPVKIPYDVAFRELLGVVVDGLKAAGEQWTDAAKQDMVSTLIISASRDGFLSCWQRGAK